MTEPGGNRRMLATRAQAWPRAIASGLGKLGFTPNQVSLLSIVIAAGVWYAYCLAAVTVDTTVWWLVAAAAGIQLRLLCNLLDGLMAVEGGLKTRTGDLYNEIPDRAADILILWGAGVAVASHPYGLALGVAAAMLAVLTAYVRLLGGSLGVQQDFSGPFAKQHRMFALTVGTLAGAGENAVRGTTTLLYATVIVIVAGTAVTLLRRIRRLARSLSAR